MRKKEEEGENPISLHQKLTGCISHPTPPLPRSYHDQPNRIFLRGGGGGRSYDLACLTFVCLSHSLFLAYTRPVSLSLSLTRAERERTWNLTNGKFKWYWILPGFWMCLASAERNQIKSPLCWSMQITTQSSLLGLLPPLFPFLSFV